MGLSNYQDVSKGGSNLHAGFQFEFFCGNCTRRWKSPFKPYRRGQLSGIFIKYAYLLRGYGRVGRVLGFATETGEASAKESALQEALVLAQSRYHECPVCLKSVCEDCWNARGGRCEACVGKGGSVRPGPTDAGADGHGASAASGPAAAALTCPNCRASFAGGRFCAECGFDMASTHKTCPGCGTLCVRAARFCTDCGHAF